METIAMPHCNSARHMELQTKFGTCPYCRKPLFSRPNWKARYFRLRERFWFERLADRVDSEIAFVCGDARVDGFVGLLKEKGISYRVCDRGIGLNDEDKYVFGNAMKYLERHPEIRNH